MRVSPSHGAPPAGLNTAGPDIVAGAPNDPADSHDMATALRLPYPRLRWLSFNSWLTLFSTLVGIALLLFPPLANFDPRIKAAATCLFLFAPAVILVVCHVLRLAWVFLRRARAHLRLLNTISTLQQRAKAAELSLYTLLTAGRRVLDIASCYNEGAFVILEIAKKKGLKCELGAELCVLDSDDARLMGTFRFVKDGGQYYLFQSSTFVDPLWRGDIVANKNTRAPLRAVACLSANTAGGTNDD